MAKLRPPAIPRLVVRRPRLVRLLADDPVPVTLLSGPAGCGKTTVLAEWGEERSGRGEPVAWLELEPRDDEPVRLWDAILTALIASGVFPPDSPIRTVQPDRAPADRGPLAEVVGAVSELDRAVWLVFDNVHELEDPGLLADLDLLVRWAPDGLRIVFSGRSVPPLALQRLRLHGGLREIRSTDLAFSRDEVATLVEAYGIPADDVTVDTVLACTEGWIAGVQIVVIAAATEPDAERFLASFRDGDRAAVDGFVEEFLRGQSAETERFLQQLSSCSGVTPSLAHELTGRSDAGAALDRLGRANLLIEREGSDGPVYRVPELLRGYLQRTIRASDRATYDRLHRSAARWHELHGDGRCALDHAIAVGDLDLVDGLLRRYGLGLLLDGRIDQLGAVLDALGEPYRSTPVAVLLDIERSLASGEVPRDRLEAVGGSIAGLDDAWLEALHAVVHLHRAWSSGSPSDELARAATTAAGRTDDDLLGLLALQHLGTAKLRAGDYTGAVDDLERAVALAGVAGRDVAAVSCLSRLAGAAAATGDLVGMREHADRALALATARGLERSSIVAYAHLLLAGSAYLRVDRDGAREHALMAVAAADGDPDPGFRLAAHHLDAVTDVDVGGSVFDAVARIRAAWAEVRGAELGSAVYAFIVMSEVRLCLSVGERAWAEEAADRLRRRFPDHGETAVVSARLSAADGETELARQLLQPVLRDELPTQAPSTRVIAWLLEASIVGPGQQHRVFEAVTAALQLAAPIGMVRPFVDARASVHRFLIANAGRFGAADPFVLQVLARIGAGDGLAPLVEPLTTAELALLRELPSPRTLSEIAVARDVSLNTVKTHVGSIYRKLDVGSRRRAVQLARLRGLL